MNTDNDNNGKRYESAMKGRIKVNQGKGQWHTGGSLTIKAKLTDVLMIPVCRARGSRFVI
jgi:hypothetical protein